MLNFSCLYVALLLAVALDGIESQPTIDNNLCFEIEGRPRLEMEDEIKLLHQQLGHERHRVKTLERQLAELETRETCTTNAPSTATRRPISVSLMKTLMPSSFARVYGIAKGGQDEIYVLGRDSKTVRVFRDQNDFPPLREIPISSVLIPHDIVYSNRSNCLYIVDHQQKCIWKLITSSGEPQLTRWLSNIGLPLTLSISRDGHVLVLRSGKPISYLEIYDFDAILIRSLELPHVIKDPLHAIQTSGGNFIISHNGTEDKRVISQLTSEGQLVNSFYPGQRSQEMDRPFHLAAASGDGFLFAVDTWNHRVILFDLKSLSWIKVLTHGDNDRPFRLFYDETKRRLFVGHWATRQIEREWRDGKVDVYDLI